MTAPELAFHVDQPSSWRLTSAVFDLAGWLFNRAGAVDIRARLDDRIFLGNYGLDRPDTEMAFGGGTAARRTGFSIRVTAWAGASRLRLEFHDGTDWREFFATDIDSRSLPSNAAKPSLTLRAALVYQTLHHLYRHFHRVSWSVQCREADRVLAEVLTANSDLGGTGEILGHIENPGHWINSVYEKFRVTGWAFLAGGAFRQLSATVGAQEENRLVYPKDRPDVAAHRADHANALASGYYGLVDLGPEIPSPANLKIFAVMPDGARRLVFARRMYLDRHDEHSGPVPIFRPFLFYKIVAALLRGRLLGRFEIDDWTQARAEIGRLRADLSRTLAPTDAKPAAAAPTRRRDLDPYTRWCWHNRLTPRLRSVLQHDASALVAAGGPLISVLVPAYNTPERYLRELLDSLRRQIYPRWELCIADDASTQSQVRRLLEEAARDEARIRPVFLSENGHIARATNAGLAHARGEFVALVDHDDVLPDDALLHVATAIAKRPTAGYLYTDEDKIDDSGRRFDPQFKGDWSPEMAITHNYTHHLSIIRRAIVEQIGGLRPEFNGAQDIDLFLRCFEQIAPADIIHVPCIGYHWRAHAESTASRGDQKSYLFEAAFRAIAEAVTRRGLQAKPMLPAFARDYALCLHQLQWDSKLLQAQEVTIVIPTRNRAELLQRCLDSLARTTPRDRVQVVVVDDASDEPASVEFLQALPKRSDLRCSVVTAAAGEEGFNYSRLVNLGTREAKTPLVLHLNNDVEAIAPGWLEDMVGWLSVPGVGIVGAKLLYPDDTVNHAGISIGREDGLPHVLFEREPAGELGYLFLPHAARNVAAVTGACLLTRTDLYRQLAGFDEQDLRVAYNDVDFCLRAQKAGFRVVQTPQAVLRHVGSASRGRAYAEREHIAFLERHGHLADPHQSDALEFPPRNLPLNPYHQRSAQVARPFKALLVTHNLKFEGAPIFAFELARFLASQPGVTVTVATPEDGPLRTRFEQAGIRVECWDIKTLVRASSAEIFAQAVKSFASGRNWDDAEVIIANTMMSFWAVHLARALDRPSAMYVHESNTVERFFAASLPLPLHPLVEAAYHEATRVVFTAAATRTFFEKLNGNDNFRTLRSWVDFDRINAFVASHDRTTLRQKHGLDPNAIVVANIGSICERKGQHIFVKAIDLLRREMPGPSPAVQWVMVGARPGLYMETLTEDLQLLGLAEVRIFPETPDIYDFYRLADILVCTSFEESFPRVLLEAMVFRTRIVSTDVNGIPEMLTHTDEAYLVPAGDPFKLAAALKKALADHAAANDKMLSMAYARAARNYHHSRALPAHLQVIREAWLG
ncbi:MAG TPA: glycosyltransferase [Candidatus Didemnitutus sp.]|nr:glycosyltransferase [Candidatus Didemnitutus sp.]